MNEPPPSYNSLFSDSKTSPPEGVSSDAKLPDGTLKQDSEPSVPVSSHHSSSPGRSPESAQRKVEVLNDIMRVSHDPTTSVSHPVPPSSDKKPAKASKNQTTRTKRQPQPTKVSPVVDDDTKPDKTLKMKTTRTKRQPQPTDVSPAIHDAPDAGMPLHTQSTQHRPSQTSPAVPQKTASALIHQLPFTAHINTMCNIVSYS